METTELPENITNDPVGAEAVKTIVKYTEDQKRYIKDHFGLESNDGIFVTRSQIDRTLPTAQRSCSLISPFGQDSFYSTTGFIFEIPAEHIPWVNNGDAGTSVVSNDIPKPESSISVEEYLKMGDKPSAKYTETIIDFQFGTPDKARAIYDFRELPQEPRLLLKLTNQTEFDQIQSEREYILNTREEWRNVAKKLNIPFIQNLPDASIVQRIRSEDKRTSDNFNLAMKDTKALL